MIKRGLLSFTRSKIIEQNLLNCFFGITISDFIKGKGCGTETVLVIYELFEEFGLCVSCGFAY